MKLTDLAATIKPWPALGGERSCLAFDCPTCGKRIEIPIRLGSAELALHTWGATTLDPETITIDPSIANPRHGRVVCSAHFTIDAGIVTMR